MKRTHFLNFLTLVEEMIPYGAPTGTIGSGLPLTELKTGLPGNLLTSLPCCKFTPQESHLSLFCILSLFFTGLPEA